MQELELFPAEVSNGIKILFVNFGEVEADFGMELVHQLRNAEVACELYPSKAKLQKQMKYANEKNVPFVALIGEEEVEQNKILLKNMASGEQSLLTPEELLNEMKNA